MSSNLETLLSVNMTDNNDNPIIDTTVLINCNAFGVTFIYRYSESLIVLLHVSYRLDKCEYTYNDIKEYFSEDIGFRDILTFISLRVDEMVLYDIKMIDSETSSVILHSTETFIGEGEEVEVIDVKFIDDYRSIVANTLSFEILAGDLIPCLGIKPVLSDEELKNAS